MNRKLLSTVFLVSLLQVSSLFVGHAYAVEGGKSLYLLGKSGPLAGLIPKPGWYHEFAVKNRVEGDAVFLTLSLHLLADEKI
jgi:hypothetical protein